MKIAVVSPESVPIHLKAFSNASYQCLLSKQLHNVNPIALRTAKTLWSFGCSECNRVKTLVDHH